MKLKSIILLIILISISVGVSFSQKDSTSQNFSLISSNFLDEYQLFGDSTLLDSALFYTELGIVTTTNMNFIGRKLLILSLKHDYDGGLDYIKTLNNPFSPSFPYYNDILVKRFQAMKYLYLGDSIMYYEVLNSIISEIKPYFIEKQELFDSLCKNDLNIIFKNEQYFLFFEYYYYQSLILDHDTFSHELLIMQNKGYSSECIDFIKLNCEDNFLEYNLF
ncbi:MAG: hypothetical protein H6Q25_1078 [Bacteroidetes bacterium]|nr:hypothetical protein [Bacteroidota bacterium]